MAKNLSKFVFKQLAYDYLKGELSGEELDKFEAKIKAEGDCFDYINRTKRSLSYVNDIAELPINLETIEGLADYRNEGLFYFYNPFSFNTPKFIKVGLPVIGLISALFAAVYLLPIKEGINWFENKQNKVVISDAEIATEKKVTTQVEVKDVKINIDPPSAVNNFKPKKQEVIAVVVEKKTKEIQAADNKIEPIKNDTSDVIITADGGKVDVNKSADNVNFKEENVNSQEFVTKINSFPTVAEKSIIVTEKKLTPEPVKEVVKKKEGPQGTLYRAYMSIRNLDEQAPIIVDIIKQMSGEKAGNERLGYLKPKGRSFHFKLPLNYREQVFEQLKAYGRVKVDKEKHWRKMPEGESRVILWVEDLDLKAERERSR